ncbi:MAG: efflux transporter outer membrane subunit [Planctomycetes bacterium]|nr:efflux transporter outer membrane subunit [Planctomycetota bacterium]
MSTTAARRARTSALLAALAACASPPPRIDDQELDVPLPATWATAAAPAPVEPPVAPGAAWWSGFGEPALDDLVDTALRDNRDLRAALARLEAAAANRTIVGAEGLPQLDAAFDPQRSRRVFIGFPFGGGGVPSTTVTTMSLALNLRWEVDLWGRVRAAESAAIGELQATAADLAGARLSLVAQVCRAWFDAVAAAQQLELADGTVAALRATADEVRERFRRGVRPAIDVHQAAANAADAEAIRARRRDELQRARRRLEILVGRYPAGAALAAATLPPALPPLPAGLPSELLQRRPDLVAAERRLAAAGCRVDSARAALYPRISLTGSAGTTSQELEDLADDDFRVWSLGANLLQPLLRGGALRAAVERAQALRAEALAAYGGAVLQAFAEVEQALASEALLAERLEAVARAAGHARQARDLARERWQLGVADFLAVADGQRQAYVAEAARIDVERQRIDNRIDLFLALGGGVPAPEQGDRP